MLLSGAATVLIRIIKMSLMPNLRLDSSPSLSTNDNWYLDIEATRHLTNEMSNLNLATEEYSGTKHIRVGNGLGLSISHIGFATIPLSRH